LGWGPATPLDVHADIEYAVAQRFGSTLLTLDREQRTRVGEAIAARTPVEMLTEMR
jgi:hypothetical protein